MCIISFWSSIVLLEKTDKMWIVAVQKSNGKFKTAKKKNQWHNTHMMRMDSLVNNVIYDMHSTWWFGCCITSSMMMSANDCRSNCIREHNSGNSFFIKMIFNWNQPPLCGFAPKPNQVMSHEIERTFSVLSLSCLLAHLFTRCRFFQFLSSVRKIDSEAYITHICISFRVFSTSWNFALRFILFFHLFFSVVVSSFFWVNLWIFYF